MQLSRAVTQTALLFKKHVPGFCASIRNNAPRKLRSLVKARMTINNLGSDDPKQVFTYIFARNWCNNPERRSGWGSELNRTVSIRADLREFVQRHSVQSLLDAPCGDFHWMQHVQWPSGFRYIGADIVHDLIVESRRKYPGVEFMELDVLKDPLPEVDAWLARDLMIHFPDEAIRAALKQFRRSRIGYLLATTYPHARQNADIRFGQVRHLNLCAPPFGLPPPFKVLREDDNPKTGRVVGVWRRLDIE
jgi:hypothetical protein